MPAVGQNKNLWAPAAAAAYKDLCVFHLGKFQSRSTNSILEQMVVTLLPHSSLERLPGASVTAAVTDPFRYQAFWADYTNAFFYAGIAN